MLKSETFVSVMSKQSEKSGNKQVGSIAEVGLMAGFDSRKTALNPMFLAENVRIMAQAQADDRLKKTELNSKTFGETLKKELERSKAKLIRDLQVRHEKLQDIFMSRLAENPEVFAGIEEARVLAIFEAMSQLMLHYFPTRISADVTFDSSIILQGHYGSFRVYWEIFLPQDKNAPPHSTLNIYNGQSLFFTGGGSPEEVITELVQIMTPLFEKLVRVQIL